MRLAATRTPLRIRRGARWYAARTTGRKKKRNVTEEKTIRGGRIHPPTGRSTRLRLDYDRPRSLGQPPVVRWASEDRHGRRRAGRDHRAGLRGPAARDRLRGGGP